MKASATLMCACAVLGAALSATAADGVIYRTVRHAELAPPGEEEVLLNGSDKAGPEQVPVQGPGSVLKGDVGDPGMYQDSGSACTDRRYFSWLLGGCCMRQPSCCDNVWDGYCAQRHQWCNKCKHAHGCSACKPQGCGCGCQGGSYAMGGYRHHGQAAGGCASCGCASGGNAGLGLGLGGLGKHHHGGCSTCGSGNAGYGYAGVNAGGGYGYGMGGNSWTSWRPFGGYFENMWAGGPTPAGYGYADGTVRSGMPAGVSYPPAPTGESILAPQPEPEMTPAPGQPVLKPEPVNPRAAQQRFKLPGLGIFQQ